MPAPVVAAATRAVVYMGASSSAVAGTFAPDTLARAWGTLTQPLRAAYLELPIADSVPFDLVAGSLVGLLLVALVVWLVSNAVAVLLRASLIAAGLVLLFAGLEALPFGGTL